MLVVHATFPVKPERREEVVELARELVEKSNQEPGMIDYRAAVDVQDENVIRFVEQYEDAAAFESHTQTDHFERLEGMLPDVLAGEPEVVQFSVDEATEVQL